MAKTPKKPTRALDASAKAPKRKPTHKRSKSANIGAKLAEIQKQRPFMELIDGHPLSVAESAGAPYIPPEVERMEKDEGGVPFKLVADFEPMGDQPKAIEELVAGLNENERSQVLLGVTGSGKTFTMANIIAQTQRPAIILAHNKTLAAQLYGEFKAFFPDNAVEYFVSYYDYYQPEAYVPRTDTYIEKESSINEQIDRMRHAATRSLLERDDVIIVSSVSCIYGIGSVETYMQMTLKLEEGQIINQQELLTKLIELHYTRNDIDFHRGTFRVRGDTIELWPAHLEDRAWRISMFDDEIDGLTVFDPLTGKKSHDRKFVKVYANSHYVTPRPTLKQAVDRIRGELDIRLKELTDANMLVEAQRLEQRCNFDIEMMIATGACAGIENYSRYLTGRAPGQPPPTLFEFLPENAILFADESHASVPQIGGMFKGDFNRKTTLAEHGFRLPSCIDNRPLRFEEWDAMRPPSVFVSATPANWEIEQAEGVFSEQVIRPTGLIDPEVDVRPATSQVDDLMSEVRGVVAEGGRVLVTTLTKRMAEDLSEYMHDNGVRVRYMHSDIDTLERIEIIRDLRLGSFDVLVGINLLREGLDIPECTLVAILDADKEGFLRSETSLVQTIGRAARNAEGRVILYADRITGSMQRAMDETDRRREKQIAYNKEHGITPRSVTRQVEDILSEFQKKEDSTGKKKSAKAGAGFAESGQAALEGAPGGKGHNLEAAIADMEKRMKDHAANLEFEEAANLRDEIKKLRDAELLYGNDPLGKQQAIAATKRPSEEDKPEANSTGGQPGTRTLRGQPKEGARPRGKPKGKWS